MNPSSESNGHDRKGSISDPGDRAHLSGTVVQFAAQRAHDLADSIHALTKQRIDHAQNFAGAWAGEALLTRAQPWLTSAAMFVRTHPARSGVMLTLVAAALWLGRSAKTGRQ